MGGTFAWVSLTFSGALQAIKSLAFAACLAVPALASDRTLLQAPAAAPGAAAAAGSALPSAHAPGPAALAFTTVDILQFALNLEYLEASLYLCATTGQGLPANLTGGGPTPTGCTQNTFSSNITSTFASLLAGDETKHVSFLRQAITAAGATPVPIPAINLQNSFTSAINASYMGMFGNGVSFNYAANDFDFLQASFLFEDLGVTAYQGAAVSGILSGSTLAAALGIWATEAYHAGAIRALLIQNIGAPELAVSSNGMNTTITLDQIVFKEAQLRQLVSNVTDAGVTTNLVQPDLPAILVPGNSTTAMTLPRTPAQVLAVVYLGSTSPTPNGFFPLGLNGNIK